MSSAVLVALLTFLGTAVTAVGLWLGVRARSSGNVKNTDADKLWESAKQMLEESTTMREELRKESAERGERIAELERLREKDRRDAAAEHRECQEELAKVMQIVTDHQRSLRTVKREVAVVKAATRPSRAKKKPGGAE